MTVDQFAALIHSWCHPAPKTLEQVYVTPMLVLTW